MLGLTTQGAIIRSRCQINGKILFQSRKKKNNGQKKFIHALRSVLYKRELSEGKDGNCFIYLFIWIIYYR